MQAIVYIFDGAHYSDRVLLEYKTNGSMVEIREQAREKVRFHRPGLLTWVDVTDLKFAPVTHFNFQEFPEGY